MGKEKGSAEREGDKTSSMSHETGGEVVLRVGVADWELASRIPPCTK